MNTPERRRVERTRGQVRADTGQASRPGGAASCVWRDAFGPGFAVAASGRMVAQAATTAQGGYKCS